MPKIENNRKLRYNTLKKKNINSSEFYLGISVVILIVMFPFFWQLMTSFKSPDEMWAVPPVWIPKKLYLGSYIAVFFQRPFARYFMNSFIIALSTTLFAVIITSFAAYALARLPVKGKNAILSLILAVSMFPSIAIISPLFLMMRSAGLLNSYIGLIITYTTITIPLSVWNLTTFFRTIPHELEESAKVDGASPFYTFIKVILPLAVPGIFTVAILVFITAWNEFIYSLTFNTKDAMRTVTVGIAMFPGEFTLPWGDMAAASIIVTVPLILMVLLFQKRIISGITSGSVKG